MMGSTRKSTVATLDTSTMESSPSAFPRDPEKDQNDISDISIPQGEVQRKKTFSFHMSFLALLVMCFIVSIDGTILAIAIPAITHELHGTTLEAFWASISFVLAVVIVQPIYTSVSNVLGRIIPLYASFILFILGSIVFASARNMGVLITGRVFQGLGSGGLDVLNEIILADITTLKERPLYLGLLAVPMAGGTILGPVVGGLLSQYTTWRWIGWINLPVSGVGLLLVALFLRLKAIDQSFRQKLQQLDWCGLLLFTIGCTLFTSPLAWAGAMFPWSSWKTLLPLCLGLVILFIFGWYESRSKEPVFPYRIFRSRTASMTLLAGFLHGAVTFSIIFYLPLFFQATYLNTPLQAAISVLPLCATSVPFGIISAVVVEFVRKYRVLVLASWVFTAVGTGLFTLLNQSASLAAKASFQIISGIGTGTLFSILNLPIQASVPNVDDMGTATGILVSVRLFGALVGLAICSTVFNNVFASQIGLLGSLPDVMAVLTDGRNAIEFIPLLVNIDVEPEILESVIEVYRHSMFAIFWMLAGIATVGFFVSLLIQEKSLEKENLGRQQFEENT
ncbi:MFS general substrate transporter [Annulohypoxylon moriforme]|nr:MFS general substrate transporter [Annulohypoxylon moriforme]